MRRYSAIELEQHFRYLRSCLYWLNSVSRHWLITVSLVSLALNIKANNPYKPFKKVYTHCGSYKARYNFQCTYQIITIFSYHLVCFVSKVWSLKCSYFKNKNFKPQRARTGFLCGHIVICSVTILIRMPFYYINENF